MVTEAQKKAMLRYNRKTKSYLLRLRLREDADVINRIESVGNKCDYLRALVRKDIERRA